MSKFDCDLQVEDLYDDLDYADFQNLLKSQSISHFEEASYVGLAQKVSGQPSKCNSEHFGNRMDSGCNLRIAID